MSVKAKRTDFGDETVQTGFREKVDTYKAKPGRRDVGRMVTDPLEFYGAQVKMTGTEKGFFATSLAEPDDIEKALAGDAAAMKKCKAACPLFERGYEIRKKFVVLWWWGRRYGRDNKFVKVNQCLPWIFGGDKYGQFRSIRSTLPRQKNAKGEKTEKPISFRLVELSIECMDEKFQKCNINAITDDTAKVTQYKELKATAAEYFEKPDDFSSECSLINDAIACETKQKLAMSLDRAEGRGKFADDAGEFGSEEEGSGAGEGTEEGELEQEVRKPAQKKPAPSKGAIPNKVPPKQQGKKPAPPKKDEYEPEEGAEGEESGADSDEQAAEDLESVLDEVE